MGDALRDIFAALGLDDLDRLDGVIEGDANRRWRAGGYCLGACGFFALGGSFGFRGFFGRCLGGGSSGR
jgi:hypothetical protein